MRYLLLLFIAVSAHGQALYESLLLLGPTAAAGGGTPAFVDWTNGVPNNASTQFRMTNSSVATGNSIVVAIGWEDTQAAWTVHSDSGGGNTWVARWRTNSGGAGNQIIGQTWTAVNVTGASPFIVVLTNGSASTSPFIKGAMIEFSGVTAFDTEGTPGTNTLGSSNPVFTGDYNTANNVEGLYTFSMNYVGATLNGPNQGWTEGYDVGGFSLQYRVTSASGTYSGRATNSADGLCIIFSGAFR